MFETLNLPPLIGYLDDHDIKKLSIGISIISYGLLSLYLKTQFITPGQTIFDVLTNPTWMFWVGTQIFSNLTKLELLTWLQVRLKNPFLSQMIWSFFDFIRNLTLPTTKQDSTKFYDLSLIGFGKKIFPWFHILYKIKNIPYYFARVHWFIMRETSSAFFGFFYRKLLQLTFFGTIGLTSLYFFVPKQIQSPVLYLITQSTKIIPKLIPKFTPVGFFSGLKSTLGTILSISLSFFELMYGGDGGGGGGDRISSNGMKKLLLIGALKTPRWLSIPEEPYFKSTMFSKKFIFSLETHLVNIYNSKWIHKKPKERFLDIIIKNKSFPSIFLNQAEGGFCKWFKRDLKGQFINEETLRDVEIYILIDI